MNPDSEGVKICRLRCNNNGVHLRPRQEAWQEGLKECVTAPSLPSRPEQDLQGPQPAVRTCAYKPILQRDPQLHPQKELTGAMGCARRRQRADSYFYLVARTARAAGGRQGGTRSLPLCARKPRPNSILETALQGVASNLSSWDLGFAIVVAYRSIPDLESPRQR